MKKIRMFFIALLPLLWSCEENNDKYNPHVEEVIDNLVVTNANVRLEAPACSKEVTIITNKESLKVTSDQEWCKVILTVKSLLISVPDNYNEDRTANIKITTDGGLETTILVSQKANKDINFSSPYIHWFERKVEVPYTTFGGKLTVSYPNGSFFKAHEILEDKIIFQVTPNTNSETRSLEATLALADFPDFKKTLTITQGEMSFLLLENQGKIEESDVLVPINSGWCETPGQDPDLFELTYDGDLNTGYHSSWSINGPDHKPSFEYDVTGADRIDYFLYYERADMGNGTINSMDISVMTKESQPDFIPLGSLVNIKNTGKVKAIVIPEELAINPLKIKFKVQKSKGNFVSFREMMFYKFK